MNGVEYVEAAELRRRPLRVAVSPLTSLFAVTRDALGAGRYGTPPVWCAAVRAQLGPRDLEVFAPLITPERILVPNALMQPPKPPGLSLKDALERIVESEDEFAREIFEYARQGPTGDWRVAARDPKRWLRAYVVTLARAWNGFAPIWQAAQEPLVREVERIGAAAARDAQLELAEGLLQIGRVRGDRWEIDACGPRDVRLSLPHDGLVMIPIVAGERTSLLDRDATSLHYAGYPLRAASAPAPGTAADPASLEALLGVPRARLLRELERPANNSMLAERLATVPSAATHHVSALEAAGLVARSRDGRHVLVQRTERGEALLALYEAA